MKPPPPQTNTLALRLEGEGLHPHTADPRVMLRIASAYFDAVVAVAAVAGVELELEGCEIKDKCLSFESHYKTAQHSSVVLVNELVAQYLDGRANPRRGTKTPINELDRALGELTAREACDIYVDGAEKISLAVPLPEEGATAAALTSMRCVVVRTGGERPTVRLRSTGEARAFVVACSKPQAVELGKRLYQQIDAELRVIRDVATNIVVGGELRAFVPVQEHDDPIAAWRDWFAPSAESWAEVDDVDVEIARMRYGEERE